MADKKHTNATSSNVADPVLDFAAIMKLAKDAHVDQNVPLLSEIKAGPVSKVMEQLAGEVASRDLERDEARYNRTGFQAEASQLLVELKKEHPELVEKAVSSLQSDGFNTASNTEAAITVLRTAGVAQNKGPMAIRT